MKSSIKHKVLGQYITSTSLVRKMQLYMNWPSKDEIGNPRSTGWKKSLWASNPLFRWKGKGLLEEEGTGDTPRLSKV